MKKFVRFIIIFLIIVIAAILVLAVIEPTDIPVSRTTIIKAPKEVVFAQMANFKNWPNWSPWYQLEPTMKITYAGADGQPGSSYHWVGDDNKTGEGEMKSIAITGTQMNFDVLFTKPHEGHAKGILKAEDTAGMTKATWTLSMHIGFPWNAMGIFMNMDKLLGGDFENGLANMKKYVEARTTPEAFIKVTEVDYPAHTFEGNRKTISWAEIGKFCNDAYDIVAKDVESKVDGHQIGIYYTWDTVNKQTDVFAGFPVTDTLSPVKGAIFTHAGPAKACMAVQKGGYSTSMLYHSAIGKYMTAKGMKPAMVLEEYVVGPKQEIDSNKWVTNIYYLEQ